MNCVEDKKIQRMYGTGRFCVEMHGSVNCECMTRMRILEAVAFFVLSAGVFPFSLGFV